MRQILVILLGICTLFCSPSASGQDAKASDPMLEVRGNIIYISYDILYSTPMDTFMVNLVVTDASGNRIRTSALSGDVGEKVSGGKGKQISWDLTKDRIQMNADIYVKIETDPVISHAEQLTEVPPEVDTTEVIPREEPQETVQEEEVSQPVTSVPEEKHFNRTMLMLQSLALPGLGLSRYRGGPHWIKGVAGYGCIAGSVLMNRKAINTYSGTFDLSDYDEQNALYEESLRQDRISEALAYVAIGIWVTDLLWTLVGTSDLKWVALNEKGITIGTTLDPYSGAPLLAFTLKF